MADQTERELKYDVPDGWALPDPAPLAPKGGAVQAETQRLHSTYFDTADRRLIRSGVTLRRRTGDADSGWHLKIPAGTARTEIRLPVDGEAVPDQLIGLVKGVTGGAPVGVVATLDTERNAHKILSPSGTPLAEIDDDRVTAIVVGDDSGVSRWHEVEIELGGGDERLLQRSSRWLARSGAKPARTGSKLARAIGHETALAAEPGSLEGVIAEYLREQHAAMVAGDIDLRRSGDVVHATRVATRRFRSVLRVFEDFFDAPRARALDAELKWYAEALGRVRDVQVLRTHLGDAVRERCDPATAPAVAEHLGRRLSADEQAARATLAEVLDQDRYVALLAEVRAWVEEVPLPTGRPATAVRQYLRAAERMADRRLGKAARAGQDDETMHRARKAAKRGRYVAELAAPVLGKPAKRRIKQHKQVQDVFGELQDAVVAAEFLAEAPSDASGAVGFALGRLWCAEQQRARRARSAARRRARRLTSR